MLLSKKMLGLLTNVWSLYVNAAMKKAWLFFRKLYNNSTVYHCCNLKKRLCLQSLHLLAKMVYSDCSIIQQMWLMTFLWAQKKTHSDTKNGQNNSFAKCAMEERSTYARSAMILFILPIAFNATTSKCNRANELIIHFFKLFLHFNLIL